MSAVIKGQWGEDLTADIQDYLQPLRVVSAPHVFGQASVDVATLAVGDVVVKAWFQVNTAYNAVTTNVITLGTVASSTKFLDATDITEGTPGAYPAAYKGPYTAETAVGVLTLAYAQTGTAATTGAGRVYALIANAAVW